MPEWLDIGVWRTERLLGVLGGYRLDGVDVLTAGGKRCPMVPSAYLSESQVPMVQHRGRGVFSLAISFSESRWSASSLRVAAAMRGSTDSMICRMSR